MKKRRRRKAPRKRLKLWLEVAFWIVLLGFIGYRLGPQIGALVGLDLGSQPAPPLRVESLEGETLDLEQLRGQVVLVNFWATWCAPCRVEMPGFQDVWERHRSDGFKLIGLSTDRTGAGAVRRFVDERGITYPVAMATGRAIRDFGGVRTLPTSFLIDREGRVRYSVTGIFTETALNRAVERLLAER